MLGTEQPSPPWQTSITRGVIYSLAVCSATIAQRCLAETELDNRELGGGYARLVSFEAEPEIAAAKFSVDSESPGAGGADINAIKLPLYREFKSQRHSWHWFAQGALSYMEMKEDYRFELFDPQNQERMESTWTAYGGLFEAGIIWPLGAGFALAPSLGIGVSRLENEVEFSNPLLEDLLAPSLDGTLYNWSTNATVARSNIALQYDRQFASYRVKGNAHFSFSQLESFNESSRFAGFSDHASTLTLKLDISHPLQRKILDYPTFIIGHAGHTSFMGNTRDQLGFSSFAELGLSLGVQKVTLGLLGILGDNVSGWNFILNYDY